MPFRVSSVALQCLTRTALCAAGGCMLLAACATVPSSTGGAREPERVAALPAEPAASPPPPRSSAPAWPRRGAYYQDDGPGDSPPANLDDIPDAEPRIEPLHPRANNPYAVLGQNFVPAQGLRPFRQRGIASWYGRKFHGQRTSSGEPYDMYAMTAAHPTLPIPSYARVSNPDNGRSVVVRINDRGPFLHGRVMDLSYTAAHKLGIAAVGSGLVDVESIVPLDASETSADRRHRTQSRKTMQASRRTEPDGVRVSATKASPPESPAVADDPLMALVREQSSDPPTAARARAEPDALPKPADGGHFLQFAAFRSADNAESLKARLARELERFSALDGLARLGERLRVRAEAGLYRLHLGPFSSREAALAAAEQLKRDAALEARVWPR